MKKSIMILLSVIIVIALTACSVSKETEDSAMDIDGLKTCNVDYCGQMALFEGAKEKYVEGTEVEISYSLIATDTNYSFFVDGQKVNAEWDDKKGYIIRFIMPSHDIEVYCEEKNLMAH